MTLNSMTAFAQPSSPERPPQFVLLAFDGSLYNAFWEDSRQFALKMRRENKPLSFTYFISGVYWLTQRNYPFYIPPHKESQFAAKELEEENDLHIERSPEQRANRIKELIADERKIRMDYANNPNIKSENKKMKRYQYSDIGFGGDEPSDIEERIRQVNMAFEEGHEMASHGNGHFKGGDDDMPRSKNWTILQWKSEFQQFINLIFNAFDFNGIQKDPQYKSGYAFSPKDIVGFRAPLLDANDAMFQALKDSGYKYDTSGKAGAVDGTIWPKKNELGTWMFPLGLIKVEGRKNPVPSMDYNFFYIQSKGISDEKNKDRYRDQMLNSYMNYFNKNYYGNRAPVHIGHHFSLWNGGAYWEAMQKFAEEVCGKPEVRCVTYSEYMNWLESQGAQTISLLSKGSFKHLPRPPDLKSEVIVGNSEPHLEVIGDIAKASFKLDQLSRALNYKSIVKVNNEPVQGTEIDIADLRKKLPAGKDVVISAAVLNKQGFEINSYSLKIKNLGTQDESISDKSMEEMALLGDMPEAHENETEQ